MTRNYNNIPEDLQWTKSWCLAGPDEKGNYKAPHGFGPRGPFKISPTQTFHLTDFEGAIEAAEKYPPCGIGFLLNRQEKYTCIDLDIKNEHNYPNKVDQDGKAVEWTTPEELARYWKIIQMFDSYTERSAGGQGFHIWVEGYIGEGCKRDGVEVYSQGRFIVCTGDVVINKDIEKRQELLDIIVEEIKSKSAPKVALVDIEETEDDHTIMERSLNADNADKFKTLFSGDFTGYPSQSEADLALLSIFCFYSKSNTQVRRLFRTSQLGQRAKAAKNDRYLNDTLRVIRSREVREEEANAVVQAQSAELLHRISQEAKILKQHDGSDPIATLRPVETEDDGGTPWPPGEVGAIAQWIYEYSPRPVKEVSIVSALGFMAGVCGKYYSISQSGLNLYIVLIARSAIGKEAMHSGIGALVKYLCSTGVPGASKFVDFTDYASGPALVKATSANPCFVNVSGEWGRKLRRLAMEDGREGPMQQLRTIMTNLYQKSSNKSIVGGIGYSDKEKNVVSVSGVAYSMIGESTPRTFYDSLTETMMEDGFLSRFTVVEYTGDRPELNLKEIQPPESALFGTIAQMVLNVIKHIDSGEVCHVLIQPDAYEILNAFDKECDQNINSTADEGFRQMWNRAHLKAYRIAALLAIPGNYLNPVINKEQVEWAINLIRRDIKIMNRRIETGDVGIGDSAREKKVLSLIHKYLTQPLPESYDLPSADKMQKEGVIPRKFLQISTSSITAFMNHRAGASGGLDMTLKSLCDSGYIQEVQKDKATKAYGFSGKCYVIINLPLSKQELKEIKEAKDRLQ